MCRQPACVLVLQVWHMVFHPAGNAGLATVLAAPRYTFMHQVRTTYEDGVHAVLFSSVPDLDVKPEWVERARARTQSVSRGWWDRGWLLWGPKRCVCYSVGRLDGLLESWHADVHSSPYFCCQRV